MTCHLLLLLVRTEEAQEPDDQQGEWETHFHVSDGDVSSLPGVRMLLQHGQWGFVLQNRLGEGKDSHLGGTWPA